MFYYIASCMNNEIRILRNSTEEEYLAFSGYHAKLAEIEQHKRRWKHAQRCYEHISEINVSLLQNSDQYSIEDLGDAISQYLFAFKKFLDNWETYIKRTCGENSQQYSVFKRSTANAYDQYDEYKIVYQLRNADQHVDRIVDRLTIGQDESGVRYIKALADCNRLLSVYKKWKAIEKQHLACFETIDIFEYLKVTHRCLTQIELDLVNSFMNADVFESCFHILDMANEFFSYREGLAFLCQSEEITREFWERPQKTLSRHGWSVPECISMLETFLKNNIHVAALLYSGTEYALPLQHVATPITQEQEATLSPGTPVSINGTQYQINTVCMNLSKGASLLVAVSKKIPREERSKISEQFQKYAEALIGK